MSLRTVSTPATRALDFLAPFGVWEGLRVVLADLCCFSRLSPAGGMAGKD